MSDIAATESHPVQSETAQNNANGEQRIFVAAADHHDDDVRTQRTAAAEAETLRIGGEDGLVAAAAVPCETEEADGDVDGEEEAAIMRALEEEDEECDEDAEGGDDNNREGCVGEDEAATAASSSSAGAASSSSSLICGSCASAAPKYTCPRCKAKSCSLACVRAHKTATGCSGERSAAEAIAIAEMTDSDLRRDFQLLSSVRTVVDNAKRGLEHLHRFSFHALPAQLQALRNAAKRKGVICQFVSEGMARRAANTSRFDKASDTIMWRLTAAFVTPDAEILELSKRINGLLLLVSTAASTNDNGVAADDNNNDAVVAALRERLAGRVAELAAAYASPSRPPPPIAFTLTTDWANERFLLRDIIERGCFVPNPRLQERNIHTGFTKAGNWLAGDALPPAYHQANATLVFGSEEGAAASAAAAAKSGATVSSDGQSTQKKAVATADEENEPETASQMLPPALPSPKQQQQQATAGSGGAGGSCGIVVFDSDDEDTDAPQQQPSASSSSAAAAVSAEASSPSSVVLLGQQEEEAFASRHHETAETMRLRMQTRDYFAALAGTVSSSSSSSSSSAAASAAKDGGGDAAAVAYSVLSLAERLPGAARRYFLLDPNATLHHNLRTLFFVNEFPSVIVVPTAMLPCFSLLTDADKVDFRESFRGKRAREEEGDGPSAAETAPQTVGNNSKTNNNQDGEEGSSSSASAQKPPPPPPPPGYQHNSTFRNGRYHHNNNNRGHGHGHHNQNHGGGGYQRGGRGGSGGRGGYGNSNNNNNGRGRGNRFTAQPYSYGGGSN